MTIIFDPIDILCKSIFEQFFRSLSHTFIRLQVFAFVSIDRIKYVFDYVHSDNTDEMGERTYNILPFVWCVLCMYRKKSIAMEWKLYIEIGNEILSLCSSMYVRTFDLG